MRAHLKVGVSTTSVLDGWAIEEYLGPVVVHTVAGSGILSDWLASWSDVFGGRSGSYQNQLRSLSDEAITAIRLRAYDQRANWVIGLTVDMDEISGQGKQMFMVTAMGTAVRAVHRAGSRAVGPTRPVTTALASARETIPTPAMPNGGRLSHEAVQAAARRLALIGRLESRRILFDEATWATITDERITEAVPFVLHLLTREIAENGELRRPEPPSSLHRAAAYLDRLGREEAISAVYAVLERTYTVAQAVVMLSKELKLRDLASIRRLLGSPAVEVRRCALQLLSAEQRSYGPEDIEHLEAVAALCEDTTLFPDITTLVTGSGKGFFGAKERLVCACKVERSPKDSHCPNDGCARDRLGFRARDVTPATAQQACLTEATLLRRVFAELAEPVGAVGHEPATTSTVT